MNDQSGFTLIELIVVIVIMGLVAGLVIQRFPLRSAGLEAQVTEQALTSALRLARSRAIAQDRDVVVVTGDQGFSLDGAEMRRLPRGQTLSVAQVVFTPDGGSTGATVVLAAGARRIRIEVSWLTGRVRMRL